MYLLLKMVMFHCQISFWVVSVINIVPPHEAKESEALFITVRKYPARTLNTNNIYGFDYVMCGGPEKLLR